MGSVIDYIECPHCKTEAYCDFYYKTGEEYINCQNCGYHYSAAYKRNDEGKFVTKDGTDNYAFDNLIMEEKELKNPYGAYRLKYHDSVAYLCGSLESEENFVNILANVREQDNVELFTVSRFVDGDISVMHIVDNGPKAEESTHPTVDDDELPF